MANDQNDTENTDNKRHPDYHVHFERTIKGEKKLIRFGAAWKHEKGEGFTLKTDDGAILKVFPNTPK